MSKMENEEFREALRQLTSEQLQAFLVFIKNATDEEFDSLLARQAAAEYVLREVRGRIRTEVSGLYEWIHDARESYSERLRHVQRGAAIRAESGRTEELVAD